MAGVRKGSEENLGARSLLTRPKSPVPFPFKRLPLRLVRDISSRGFVNHAKLHEADSKVEEIASKEDCMCETRP